MAALGYADALRCVDVRMWHAGHARAGQSIYEWNGSLVRAMWVGGREGTRAGVHINVSRTCDRVVEGNGER